MIPDGLLVHAILVVGALFYATLLLFFGHGVWLDLRRRRAAPRLARGRTLLVSLTSRPHLDPEEIRILRSLPLRYRIRLIAELAPSISGIHRQRLHGMAREIGLVREAETLTRSWFWWRRLRGVRLLTAMGGGEEVVPPLLDDPHPAVRADAAAWAAEHPEPHVMNRLLEHLADPSRLCRFTVRDTLLRMGERAVGPLGAYLDAQQGPGVEPALEVAAALADPAFLAPATRHARHPSAAVRARAAELAGAVGGSAAVETLVALLDDPAPEVRAAALDAVGKLGHWPAAPAVARLLRDSAWAVRRAAGLALRRMGSPGLLLLRRALGDADPFAADMARQVLDLPAEIVA